VSAYRIGIDTGGTFTDLVAVEESTGALRTVKVPSTPQEPAAAAFEALGRSGLDTGEIGFFVLGTTIATNCLLERKGRRVLYVTTAGFEDVPYIQRVDRKWLYDLQWVKPTPYVARPDCIGVRERVLSDGSVRTPLEEAEVERVVEELRRRDAAAEGGVAVAVNLLFSYAFPGHERRLAEAIRRELPQVSVSVSSEVAPIWREYERGNTVIVDAYLSDLVGGFARELDRGLSEAGVRCPRFFLKSNGGQVALDAAGRQPVNFVLSGLAGGMVAGKRFADAVGRKNVITLDMGGTSADVGVVVDGTIRNAAQYEFEFGLPIAIPVIDLSTIGAGGSSIAGFDQGGFLEVGPESAGADPGPASYGKGSERATVTDANLVLGRLNPESFLGGEFPLDPELARAAIERIAAGLGVALEVAADAIVEVACENMAGAVRLLCADRGLDYRSFDLMAFGGAGPMHGALLARRVGLRGLIVPPSPGLASAFGAQAASLRVDRRLTRVLRSDLTSDAELRAGVEWIAREALEELTADGAEGEPLLLVGISSRYLGQNFEQEVPVPLDAEGDLVVLMVERFHEQHRRAYGYRLDGAVIEFVDLNAIAVEQREPPRSWLLAGGNGAEPAEVKPVYFKERGWVETPVYRRGSLGAGTVLEGPAILEEVDSTTVILAGQIARVDPTGCLLIDEVRTGRGGASGE
jgi:N-methylhydantoinase A